jgi:Lon protease-like protein
MSQFCVSQCCRRIWIFLFFLRSSNAFLSNNAAKSRVFLPKTRQSIPSVHSAANPNDLVSPEERDQRMELVRQIQKSFYVGEEGVEFQGTTLENLPLWRVQWTELPGYQNVLNCHVPHYTHMFNKILAGPKPWYFGHIYLPKGSDNLDNPDYKLLEGTDATMTGVLMQVSDYRQLDDGRLVLIVQALERFRVVEATQHTPYAIANVEFIPDTELVQSHLSDAQQVVADALLTEDHSWSTAYAAAVAEAVHWHPFEFRYVDVQEAGGANGAVAPLVNFDAEALNGKEFDAIPIMQDHVETSNSPKKDSIIQSSDPIQLEYEVWVALDTMIRLLTKLNPDQQMNVPIPTQMLGLIPKEPVTGSWPDGFALSEYAAKLEREKAMVGTATKSPFVQVDDVASTYPALRRAHRLSYAVWMLLESIVVEGTKAVSQQTILEMESISARLLAAKMHLDGINYALRLVSEQGPFEML